MNEVSGVRVRFAPSPTGYLHMGGARTALFNWLFARHEEGTFILRIEDTDIERSSDELEEKMLNDLTWLGLVWDEGPRTEGGRGPYRQSERLTIYREYADHLIAAGNAYPCFCTDEELEKKKTEQRRAGLPPQYDGTCRRLGEREREERRRREIPESVRFIVPKGEKKQLDDIIRREVTFPPDMVGDFVIIRSNGLPTYNFAAAVDDAFMGITHVIRGEEHLSNTLRQMMIYESLGLDQPRFAHIPLILGPDRSKLSKRHGAPNIGDFRDMGYPAEAVVNYLAFLGWSTTDQREILTVDELVNEFTLERVSPAPSIFDKTKLNWFSSHYIRVGGAVRYFEDALPYFSEELRTHYSRDALKEIFGILSENLPCLSRIGDEVGPFRPGPPGLSGEAMEVLKGSRDLIDLFITSFRSAREWNKDTIKGMMEKVGTEFGVKGRKLFMPLRAALTGVVHGPELLRILELRGKGDVVESLQRVREKMSGA